jgi:carbon storage regulator
MLVIVRKLGESIVIGDDVVVTVREIDRGKVRLGIEAPREVPIFRSELLEKGQPHADGDEASRKQQQAVPESEIDG